MSVELWASKVGQLWIFGFLGPFLNFVTGFSVYRKNQNFKSFFGKNNFIKEFANGPKKENKLDDIFSIFFLFLKS